MGSLRRPGAAGITLFELLSGGEGPDPVNEEGEVGEALRAMRASARDCSAIHHRPGSLRHCV